MDFFNKLRNKIIKGNIKQMTYNIVTVIIVCLILLISWSFFSPKEDKVVESSEMANMKAHNNNNIEYTDSIEKRLEKILSKINGVGDVEVLITYETSKEVVPALNTNKSTQTTKEKDKQGGTRTINQETVSEDIVTVSNNDYKNSPIVIKEIEPTIRGVIVVAKGAGQPAVKKQLIEAVTTIFQIKSHKVKIYEKK